MTPRPSALAHTQKVEARNKARTDSCGSASSSVASLYHTANAQTPFNKLHQSKLSALLQPTFASLEAGAKEEEDEEDERCALRKQYDLAYARH